MLPDWARQDPVFFEDLATCVAELAFMLQDYPDYVQSAFASTDASPDETTDSMQDVLHHLAEARLQRLQQGIEDDDA